LHTGTSQNAVLDYIDESVTAVFLDSDQWVTGDLSSLSYLFLGQLFDRVDLIRLIVIVVYCTAAVLNCSLNSKIIQTQVDKF